MAAAVEPVPVVAPVEEAVELARVAVVLEEALAVVLAAAPVEVVVGQVPAVEPVPVPVAAMELEPAQVRVQGLVLVRVQPHRSALDLMRPSVPALVPRLAPEPPEALDWAPVPAHPLVPGRAGRLGTEPATGPEMGPGTRASGLKTEPASERLRSDRQDRIMEQSGTSSVTLCSMI